MLQPTPNPVMPPSSRFLNPLLHIGFALTGVGTVLLGAILPQISAQWHLQDQDAARLLLVQFAASASGALLVRRNLWKTLAIGYAFAGIGAMGVFLVHRQFFGLAFGVLGLGLGMAMTSTNMLIARRSPAHRGAALAFLNFCWSAGAVACPIVASQFVRYTGGGQAFSVLGILIAPFAMLPLLADRSEIPAVTELAAARLEPAAGKGEWATIAYFALLAFLYVGMEASVGNWMSTYATRVTSWQFAGSSMAVAAFWGALLLGRAFTAPTLALLNERRLYSASLIAVIGGILLLLLAHGPAGLLAGAVLMGMALAPVFPLVLSMYLKEIGGSRNAGWVFAVAGLGGATLSWLTGILSSDSGSLRIGLMVPGAAALLMAATVPWLGRRRSSEAAA
jgi:FHS family glucose/mannose:H+ symporter-like MFS transporter